MYNTSEEICEIHDFMKINVLIINSYYITFVFPLLH